MSNNGVWNEGRAERYGPNDPRQRGDRDRYRYVYWIYTAIRHWMRRAIERVKKAAALRGRYDILGNRGGPGGFHLLITTDTRMPNIVSR